MIIYQGLFFDGKTKKMLQRAAKELCGQDIFFKNIEDVHITYKYKPPEETWFHANEIGEEVCVNITGFGDDGENVAFEVHLDDPRYEGAKVPHITMFLKSEKAKARNSGKLTYQSIKPFSVKGRLGFYTDNGVIAETIKEAAV